LSDEKRKRLEAAQRHKTLEKGSNTLAEISINKYKLWVAADWRYRQFFNYLQISPSYDLARRYVSKIARDAKKRDMGIEPEPMFALPADFSKVLKTYEAFGDVTKTDFWDWWLERAQHELGISAEPELHELAYVPRRIGISDRDLREASKALRKYFRMLRPQEGEPASLVVAIPIHGDRKKILRSITPLIVKALANSAERSEVARFQMIRDKSHEETIKQALRVVRARASRPDASLFEVGKRSISSVHAAAKPGDYDKRRALEQQTSKYLQRALALAENAARGRFPSLAPLKPDENRPDFEYPKLRDQISAYIRRMEKKLAAEKARLATRVA